MFPKWAWSGSREQFLHCGLRNSLSGHGQGHVSNFYIVDLENFVTASRRYTGDIHRYTGDIHNSSLVGLFMTPIRQWKRLECDSSASRLSAHVYYISVHLNPPTS